MAMAHTRRRIIGGIGAAVVTVGGTTAFASRGRAAKAAYDDAVLTMRASLAGRADLRELVRYATLAANGHNTQPWRFRLDRRRIEIRPDLTRRTPVVDPDDHHLFASLGCALENLVLAAAATGQRAHLQVGPDAAKLVVDLEPGVPEPSALCEAIPRRQSTRSVYDGRAASAVELHSLAAAARVPGVDVILVTDRPMIERILQLIVAGNDAQVRDKAFVRELMHWIRFNPQAALQAGDGLFSGATGNPALPTWLGRSLFPFVFRPGSEKDKCLEQVRSAAGLAIFVAERNTPQYWVRAGRSCQRLALQATALGLRCAFLNQPVEVARLRPELASLVGLPGRRPNLVLRFGHGAALPSSPRRPVSAVIDGAATA
jgi:nitroreductase